MLRLKQTLRRLFRAPCFSLAVIGSLAICSGPNTAIFSALYALVLKPLPFPEASQLVTVQNLAERSGGQVVRSSTTQYLDFKAHADLFSGFATLRVDSAALDDSGASPRVEINRVSANFFDLLQVQPVLGRFFTAEEETAGKDQVLAVTTRFWKTRFQGDPQIVGAKVILDGQPFTIVGVVPSSLECFSPETAFYQPYAAAASRYDLQTRYRGDLALYGRLKPGVTAQAARAQLISLEEAFRTHRASPALQGLLSAAGYRLALEPLRPGGAVAPRHALWLLQGGALFVLMIGCVNVVNLFLTRLNSKRSEIAIRAALGASRPTLVADLLAETLCLTGAGVALGTWGGSVALEVFNRYLPLWVPGAPSVKMDALIIFTTIAAALLIAFLVGLLPLYFVGKSRIDIIESRTSSASRRARRASTALAVSQIAFAVTLLFAASLLLRSFARVLANDPGYDATHLILSHINLPNSYQTPAARLGAQQRVLEAFKAVPGVDNAAASLRAVLGNERPVPFARRSDSNAPEAQPLIHIVAVSPEFFSTMGMPLLSGRGFDQGDEFSKNPVAIVDREFSERYTSGRPVEGEEIYLNWGFPLGVDAWPRIVGVVGRANLTGLDSRDRLPIVYVPTVGFASRGFDVIVHSPRATADIVRDLRIKLREIDPSLQLSGGTSLEGVLTNLLLPRRGITLLAGLFSALALLLAGVGLYGVLSYEVSQRTREIGIRGAIGASRGQITREILREGMTKSAIGLVGGCLGAYLSTHYLSSLLFEVGAHDAISFATGTLVLAVVSFAACWLPARRAARVDPIVALRAE